MNSCDTTRGVLTDTHPLAETGFASARALLRWANESIQEADVAANAFLDGHPYTGFFDTNPQTGEKLVKVRMANVPDQVCKFASHALWDIKHALDHATSSAVREIYGNATSDVHFPIGSHLNDLNSKLAHVPKGATAPKYPVALHELFRSFEPYRCGDGYAGGSDDFCTLSKLANSTKHSVALATAPRPQIVQMKGTGGLMKFFPDGWDGTKQEFTLGVVQPGAEWSMELQLACYVTFRDIKAFEGYPATEVLRAYGEFVENIVIALEDAVLPPAIAKK